MRKLKIKFELSELSESTKNFTMPLMFNFVYLFTCFLFNLFSELTKMINYNKPPSRIS